MARCKAAVVTSSGGGWVASSLRRLQHEIVKEVLWHSPVEIPLSDDRGDRHATYTTNNAPCPHPQQRHKDDEPSSVGPQVEYPSVLPRMTPIPNCAEPNDQSQERDGSNRKHTEQEWGEQ